MLKNEKGFTLIEMLIVLMIISVLLILIVPNLVDKGKDVNAKGCKALVTVVQAQADAYRIEENDKLGDINKLVDKKYITEEQKTCPNGDVLSINEKGKVSSTPSGK